uniref:Fe2OG dioxygenase domain-containing protein n=1 Tax=Prymnesium polylepis TaxID=72548 RepID=A0A7S4ITM9_9EUKA
MQLLKYGPGEYYRLHHDWIPEQVQALCGPRVFTFFLYLSDVEEGGGTQFPYLKDENGAPITVQARKGTAVWWPHGLESNPWQKDDRTHHEAMPVIVGKKMAANYWIHGSDFKGSMAAGCDGRSGVSGRVWRK